MGLPFRRLVAVEADLAEPEQAADDPGMQYAAQQLAVAPVRHRYL
jgi:hypothetical protein